MGFRDHVQIAAYGDGRLDSDGEGQVDGFVFLQDDKAIPGLAEVQGRLEVVLGVEIHEVDPEVYGYGRQSLA